MLSGFAGNGFARQLESPSVKMDQSTGKAVPMQRKEVVGNLVKFLEEDLEKIKDLQETPETKDMVQTAVALYEYVLPVYKKEYGEIAALYDAGADKEKITAQVKAVNEKYAPKYDELFNKLIGIGKGYAERHSIKVNWE